MKYLASFLLLCGLLSSPASGQSVSNNDPFVVLRYVSLSCSAPQLFHRKAKPEVILGSFDSFHAIILNSSPSLALWQASSSDKEEEMETLLGKTGAFSLPAVIVGVRQSPALDQTNVQKNVLKNDQKKPASQPAQDYRPASNRIETLQANQAVGH
jgi:hypothetical protein